MPMRVLDRRDPSVSTRPATGRRVSDSTRYSRAQQLQNIQPSPSDSTSFDVQNMHTSADTLLRLHMVH